MFNTKNVSVTLDVHPKWLEQMDELRGIVGEAPLDDPCDCGCGGERPDNSWLLEYRPRREEFESEWLEQFPDDRAELGFPGFRDRGANDV